MKPHEDIFRSRFMFTPEVLANALLSISAALIGLNDRGSIPGKDWDFSLHHRFQTGSGPHPASYPMGNGGFFPWGKAAEA
jgi:hypothetical protein